MFSNSQINNLKLKTNFFSIINFFFYSNKRRDLCEIEKQYLSQNHFWNFLEFWKFVANQNLKDLIFQFFWEKFMCWNTPISIVFGFGQWNREWCFYNRNNLESLWIWRCFNSFKISCFFIFIFMFFFFILKIQK